MSQVTSYPSGGPPDSSAQPRWAWPGQRLLGRQQTASCLPRRPSYPHPVQGALTLGNGLPVPCRSPGSAIAKFLGGCDAFKGFSLCI